MQTGAQLKTGAIGAAGRENEQLLLPGIGRRSADLSTSTICPSGPAPRVPSPKSRGPIREARVPSPGSGTGDLLSHVDCDGRAETFYRSVQVVPDLKRQSVHARRQLHVDDVLPVTEVYPWRGSGNRGAGRQAVGIDGDVMMTKVRSRVGHRTRGHGGDRKVLCAELQPHRTLDRGPIGRLDEKHPTPLRRRLAACAEHECHEGHCYG